MVWHSKFEKRKDKQKIDVYSMSSKTLVAFLHVRRWVWRNITNFHSVLLLVCVSSIQYESIGTFWHMKTWYNFKIFDPKIRWFFMQVIYNFRISRHFNTENHSDMVKLKFRVTSHELRVENLKAQVESLKDWVKIQKWEFKCTSYEFKSTSYEFKSAS